MSKILLVTSNFEENVEPMYADREKVMAMVDGSHYPLGLPYIHSYMESLGHEVRTLFLNSYGWELCFSEMTKALEEFRPDIVGFQMLTQNRVSTYKLMEHIHEKYPNIKIVAGGVHASIMYEQLVKKYPYLMVVIGEGEISFAELVKALEEESELANVDGIAFSREGRMVKTRHRPLIKDLDMLPFPKHELYFNDNRMFGCLLTSRGCPCKCSFCALDSISLGVNRTRSVKNVIEEIELMMKQFPQMKRIWIHDDTFFLNNKRVIEFCDEVIKRKIKMEFICSGRIKPFTEEMAKKLEEANFTKIMFGLESGVDSILVRAHKGITQQRVLDTFRILSKTKLDVMCFLIVGLPGETEETIIETANFVKKLQKMRYIRYGDAAILRVYPGTEVYRIAKEKGQLTDDYWLGDGPTPHYLVENSEEELVRYEKLLLDRIAIDRILTWNVLKGDWQDALKAQWEMLPYGFAYLAEFTWKRKGPAASRLVSKVIRKIPVLGKK
ncbi:MAG: radical SAM protein [Candidatus Burarchaeum sp.]|nr:radical SAM protein [Candidatus Burarchaeum sp.]MDO8339040.1 radical SAM protein [Candidatus Burarchaeum sp.]